MKRLSYFLLIVLVLYMIFKNFENRKNENQKILKKISDLDYEKEKLKSSINNLNIKNYYNIEDNSLSVYEVLPENILGSPKFIFVRKTGDLYFFDGKQLNDLILL